MKNKLLIICLLLISCFCLYSCGKEDEEEIIEKPDVIVSEKDDIKSKINLQNVGLVIGEYSNRYTVIKVNNGNDRAIYVDVKITYYDASGNEVDMRDVYVRVGSFRSAYAVDRMFAEDVDFATYKYDFDVSTEKLREYETIYNNMKVTYVDTGKNVNINFNNIGDRPTTVSVYVFFKKDGNIVAVSDATEYNLPASNIKTQVIDYPHKTANILIPFDKIEVVLNEVSTEL